MGGGEERREWETRYGGEVVSGRRGMGERWGGSCPAFNVWAWAWVWVWVWVYGRSFSLCECVCVCVCVCVCGCVLIYSRRAGERVGGH